MAQASTARGGAIADAVLMASRRWPAATGHWPVAVHANASASAVAVAHEQEGERRAMQKLAVANGHEQEGVRTELQWP